MSLPKRSRWRMLLMLLTLLPPLLLTAACTPPEEEGEETAPEETSAADEEAVRQIADDWEAAYNAGDASGIAQLYAEDAVRFANDGQLMEGRAAIEEQLATALAQGGLRVGLAVDEVHLAGDAAYVRGQWHLTATPEEGDPVEAHGKWLTVDTRQEDGSWKISVDGSNSNAPPPGEGDGEEGEA